VPQDALPEYCDELRRFRFISPRVDALSLFNVVETASEWLLAQEGKKGLVIDPWNELEHWRQQGISETEYVSQSLSFLRNWARANNVHVWLVAHPAKQPREGGKLPTPTPDMISGSQHFWNKADCAITVYRDPDDPGSNTVGIFIQKVRFKHIGKPGMVRLTYNKVNGRYSEFREPGQKSLYAVRED
jgi:twinkle protein